MPSPIDSRAAEHNSIAGEASCRKLLRWQNKPDAMRIVSYSIVHTAWAILFIRFLRRHFHRAFISCVSEEFRLRRHRIAWVGAKMPLACNRMKSKRKNTISRRPSLVLPTSCHLAHQSVLTIWDGCGGAFFCPSIAKQFSSQLNIYSVNQVKWFVNVCERESAVVFALSEQDTHLAIAWNDIQCVIPSPDVRTTKTTWRRKNKWNKSKNKWQNVLLHSSHIPRSYFSPVVRRYRFFSRRRIISSTVRQRQRCKATEVFPSKRAEMRYVEQQILCFFPKASTRKGEKTRTLIRVFALGVSARVCLSSLRSRTNTNTRNLNWTVSKRLQINRKTFSISEML